MSQFFSALVDVLQFEHLLWGYSSLHRCKAQQVLFIGFGLWSIYRVHNANVFDAKQYSSDVIIFTFKHMVSSHLSTLAYSVKYNDQLTSFYSKWLKPPFTLGLFGSIIFM
jgi:hypothetical protein